MRQPQRILVIRPDRIGDVILATPLLRALRRSFPSAWVAAMVRPYARDVLLHNPNLDAIVLDDDRAEHAGLRGFWRQVASLRRQSFDTALLLLPTERLAWMLLCAGIRTRITVGLKPYQVLTGMRTVSRHKYVPLRHEADYCLDLGRRIGVQSNDLTTEVFLTDDERQWARQLLHGPDAGGPVLVGIHPNSGGSAPNWCVERYVQLAERLLRNGRVQIIVTGAASERALTAPFRRLDPKRCLDLVGKLTLRQLMAVVSHFAALVSASTGPMHIAAALGVPTVSLFCPLEACSPHLWGPQGNRAEVVLPADGYCTTRCPGNPRVCDFEGGIDVETVLDRVEASLRQAAAGRRSEARFDRRGHRGRSRA